MYMAALLFMGWGGVLGGNQIILCFPHCFQLELDLCMAVKFPVCIYRIGWINVWAPWRRRDKEVVFWAYNTAGERCSGVKSLFALTTANPQRLSLIDPSRVMRIQSCMTSWCQTFYTSSSKSFKPRKWWQFQPRLALKFVANESKQDPIDEEPAGNTGESGESGETGE